MMKTGVQIFICSPVFYCGIKLTFSKIFFNISIRLTLTHTKMVRYLIPFIIIGLSVKSQAQNKDAADKKAYFLKQASIKACNCIDSLERDKAKEDLNKEISDCIDKQVSSYNLGISMTQVVEDLKKEAIDQVEGKKKKKKGQQPKEYVLEAAEPGSRKYKERYQELEYYLMEHCEILKLAIGSDEEVHANSVSNDPNALSAYNKGVEAMKGNNFKAALPHFLDAVKFDSTFAFAWDNVGICYRNLGEIDKAIDAYKTSLFFEPSGITPLQNLAVAYTFKEDYDQAIVVYEKITKVYPKNPEGYFGLGRVYTAFKNDLEQGLDYMCKSYNLYTEQKSPYRVDAETLMGAIYQEMKKQGKEEKFMQILKDNNILMEE